MKKISKIITASLAIAYSSISLSQELIIHNEIPLDNLFYSINIDHKKTPLEHGRNLIQGIPTDHFVIGIYQNRQRLIAITKLPGNEVGCQNSQQYSCETKTDHEIIIRRKSVS